MAGRKSKLTEELTEVICKNIELGMSYNLSCQAAGIHPDTFFEWMKAGAAGTETPLPNGAARVCAAGSAAARTPWPPGRRRH